MNPAFDAPHTIRATVDEIHPSAWDALAEHRLLPGYIHNNLEASECSCRLTDRAPKNSLPPRNAALEDGGICFACGGLTVRTGSCTTCTECGTTSGCG